MVVGYIFYLSSNKSIALLINAFKLSPFAFAFSCISSFLPFATIRLILSYACLLNSLLYLIAFVLSLYAITAPPNKYFNLYMGDEATYTYRHIISRHNTKTTPAMRGLCQVTCLHLSHCNYIISQYNTLRNVLFAQKQIKNIVQCAY